MNELIEQPIQQQEEQIRVIFTFVNNWTFTQHVFVKDADMVEDLLAWFRNKKSKPMWTWDYTKVSKLMLIQKSHIVAIDIEGYIELTRTTHKWQEKLFDKLVTTFLFAKLKVVNQLKPNKDKPIKPIVNMASKGIQSLKAAFMGRKQNKK